MLQVGRNGTRRWIRARGRRLSASALAEADPRWQVVRDVPLLMMRDDARRHDAARCLGEMFAVLARHGAHAEAVSTSATRVAAALRSPMAEPRAAALVAELAQAGVRAAYSRDRALLHCLAPVGAPAGALQRDVSAALAGHGVESHLFSASRDRLSLLVCAADLDRALLALQL